MVLELERARKRGGNAAPGLRKLFTGGRSGRAVRARGERGGLTCAQLGRHARGMPVVLAHEEIVEGHKRFRKVDWFGVE